MLTKINTVLNLTSAFKVVNLFQKRKFSKAGNLSIYDPKQPKLRLQVNTFGLIEPNLKGFGSGTWLDFAVYAKNEKHSYEETLQWILEELGLVNKVGSFELKEVAQALASNRIVIDTLLKSIGNLYLKAETTKFRKFIGSKGIKQEYAKYCVFALQGRTLNYFSDLGQQFFDLQRKPEKHFKDLDYYFCVPYFVNQHLIDHIEVFTVGGSFKHFADIHFLEAKYSFSNLFYAPVTENTLHVFDDFETVLSVLEKHQDHQSNIGVTNVSINKKGKLCNLYYPNVGIFFPNNTDVESLFDLYDLFSTFKISEFKYFLNPTKHIKDDIEQYVKDQFILFAQEDQCYSPRIADLIEGIKVKERYIQILLEESLVKGWSVFVNILESIQKNNVLFSTNNYTLFKTREGYDIILNKTGNREHITNFTFCINSRILFSDTLDQYYDFEIKFKDQHIKIFTDSSNLETDVKIKKLIHQYFLKSLPKNIRQIPIDVPAVNEVHVSRILTHIIAHESKNVPTILGLTNLGFTDDKQQWNLPNMSVDRFGYKIYNNYIRPDSIIFSRFYEFSAVEDTITNKEAPAYEASLLMLAFVSTFVRWYTSGVFKSIVLNAQNWKQVLSLLNAFGQKDIIRPSRNYTPDELLELNGIPFLMAYVETVPSPCFMISNEQSSDVWTLKTDATDDTKYKDASLLFKSLLIRVVQILMEDFHTDYLQKMFLNRSIETMNYIDMVAEGKFLLQLFEINYSWLNSTVSDTLQSILSDEKSTDGVLSLNKSKYSNVILPLKSELFQHKLNVKETKTHLIIKEEELLSIVPN